MFEIELSGKSDAKGRNGYFKAHLVKFWRLPMSYTIDVFSSRVHGNTGPISLKFTRQDAEAMRDGLNQLLED